MGFLPNVFRHINLMLFDPSITISPFAKIDMEVDAAKRPFFFCIDGFYEC